MGFGGCDVPDWPGRKRGVHHHPRTSQQVGTRNQHGYKPQPSRFSRNSGRSGRHARRPWNPGRPSAASRRPRRYDRRSSAKPRRDAWRRPWNPGRPSAASRRHAWWRSWRSSARSWRDAGRATARSWRRRRNGFHGQWSWYPRFSRNARQSCGGDAILHAQPGRLCDRRGTNHEVHRNSFRHSLGSRPGREV